MHIITLLVDNADGSGGPTGEGSAKPWLLEMESRGIDMSGVNVVADPMYSMVAGGGSFGTPMQTVVDPRTMQVVHSHQGYKPGPKTEVEALAAKNQVP